MSLFIGAVAAQTNQPTSQYQSAKQSAHTSEHKKEQKAEQKSVQRVVIYRGMFDGKPLQMTLRPDPEFPESIEGEYFIFGTGQTVQLAGEWSKNKLWMEESINGTDVSGEWSLTSDLERKNLYGEWVDDQGEQKKKVELKLLK